MLAAVERAAAIRPPERFRSVLTPTATKLYATLLRADGPLGRSELIDRTDISASSYHHRLSDVRDLDRVTPVQQRGHHRWARPNLTQHRKTPPVTAWLTANRIQTTTSIVVSQQLITLTGPRNLATDHKR
jgi:DNA-binding transcriptional regulator GbsR (MarR family)